jgi:RNA polymerase sigma-70 factor (ECF subfamily)
MVSGAVQYEEDRARVDRTDEQLLAAFVAGDRGALGELAARHERALLGLASGLTGSRSAACDAVQNAWVRVIRHAKGFRGHSSVRTWLFRIVINECNDMRKARRRDTGMNGPLETADGAAASMAEAEADASQPADAVEVRRAVDELDDSRRVVVLLCYSARITHEVAADVLGLPVGTLKSRLHAALTTLRRRLSEGVRA